MYRAESMGGETFTEFRKRKKAEAKASGNKLFKS